jgi:cobalt-zinc-cadmium efflux system membrane fusion protein
MHRLLQLIVFSIGVLVLNRALAENSTPEVIVLSLAQRAAAGIETSSLDRSGPASAGHLTFAGRVEFAERGPTVILAPAAARVTAAFAHPGETVRAGEPLLSLGGPELLAARHSLATATSSAEAAAQRLERDTSLYAIGAIARGRLETTQAHARDAQSALAAARGVLAGGRFEADGSLQLRAPVSGQVMGPALAPGDQVSAGEVLAYVSSAPAIHISLAVPATIARSLALGDPVAISAADCEGTGRIHAIGRNIDEQTQAIAVHASLDGKPCFLPGESVTASVAPRAATTDAYSLPATAFVTARGKTYVFVETPQGYLPVAVDTFGTQAGYARAPTLRPGTQVVTRGTAILMAAWQKRES